MITNSSDAVRKTEEATNPNCTFAYSPIAAFNLAGLLFDGFCLGGTLGVRRNPSSPHSKRDMAGARMRRESANLRYGQLTGWAAPATAGDLVTGLFHFHVQIWDHDHQCIGLT